MIIKLDKKDRDILKILDENFRTPLSKVAKKVRLSKNSVALRFDRIKDLISHTTTGINNKLLGYTLFKIYYSLDFLDEKTEKELIKEFKKHKNMLYIARLYGHYNFELAFFIKDIDDFIIQSEKFNKKFAKKINEKEIQILIEQFYFRSNFIYDSPSTKTDHLTIENKKISLTDIEKKIISVLRNNSRMNILDIAAKTRLNPKTVSTNMHSLEKRKIISGYFVNYDASKLGFSRFKLLLQIDSTKDIKEFEKYITNIKNAKHISKMLGLWDYEIDVVYKNIIDLQNQIEILKKKFPNVIKRLEIINFGQRMITSSRMFLD